MFTLSCRSATVFGLSHSIFSLHDTVLGKLIITSDVALLLLGVFNKIVDYLMDHAIGHAVQTISTLRMARPHVFGARFAGIKLRELKLKEELTRPWKTIWAVHKRRKLGDFQKHVYQNSALTVLKLITSVCFLLIGAGLNTIGYPKDRWYPDSWVGPGHLVLSTPQQTLVDVDWWFNRDVAIRSVGDNANIWPVAQALAGVRLYDSLVRNSDWAAQVEPDQWRYVDGIMARVVSSDNSIESAMHPNDQVQKIRKQLESTAPYVANISTGAMGKIMTTTARLTTSCSSSNSTGPFMKFQKQDASSFSISLPYDGMYGGLMVNCSLTFRQASLLMQFWTTYDYGDEDDLHNDSDWGHAIGPRDDLDLLETREMDASIVDKLAEHLNDLVPVLDRATPRLPFSDLTSLMVDSIVAERAAQNSTAVLDVPLIMAPMIAYLTQQALASATWTTANSDDNSTVSHQLRFRIYGSGPRLSPEYIAVVPLFVMALVCIFDLALLLYRVKPAPWLEPAGLLCLANSSSELSFIGQSDVNAAAKADIFVRAVNEKLRIVDERPDDTDVLERRQGYRYR